MQKLDEETIEKTIIKDIDKDIPRVTKQNFFPLMLDPTQKEFLKKHTKNAGYHSESAFIIDMFESFFKNGQFIYTYQTKVNNKLEIVLRNIATNLNQARAAAMSESTTYRTNEDIEFNESIISAINSTFKLLTASHQLLRSRYRIRIPTTCLEIDRAKREGAKNRPKVLVKKVRTKLYLSNKQRALFDKKRSDAGKPQLSRFLREYFVEMHTARNFKYRSKVSISTGIQTKVKKSSDKLNDAIHAINTSVYFAVSDRRALWLSLQQAMKSVRKELIEFIKSYRERELS